MDKSIQFIVISDIHTSQQHLDVIMTKFLQIGELVGLRSLNVTDLIVVLPGDIVQSGKVSEFKDFLSIFELMKEDIQQKHPTITISVLCVPGNHDVDLSTNDEFYNIFHENDEYGPRAVELFLRRQDNFFQFYHSLVSKEIKKDERLHWRERIETQEGHSISFSMINSSCFIERSQSPENLFYPSAELDKSNHVEKSDLRIALMHHPITWFQTKIKKELRKKIEKDADIIITGHCHLGDSYNKSKGDTKSYYMESSVFHDPYSEMEEEIHTAYLTWTDTYEACWNECSYHWTGERFTLIPDSESSHIIYTKHVDSGYAFSQEHGEWLEELPVSPTLPTGRIITTDDLFVYPRLHRVRENKTSSLESTINSQEIISSALPIRCLIHGESQSGKTMLAKQYIKELRSQGKTPVYLNFAEIGNRDFMSYMDSEYKRQYGTRISDEVLRLQPQQLALIIDNFDQDIRRVKNKSDLLIELTKKCETLIAFASDISSSAYLFNTDICKLLDNKFRIYKILELNHTAKHQLLLKWNSLCAEGIGEEKMGFLIAEQERNMNALLGKSLVPKYPIYVLLFLQAMSQSASISETEIGTYGSLYEIVIKNQLASVTNEKFNLQTLSNYLCELAYHMYCSGKMRLNESDYKKFADSFNAKYETPFNTDKIISILITSGVISAHQRTELDEYYFTHSYSFYYFIARYLNSNRDDDKVIEEIKKLCNNFQNEKQANIWLFLTHLSSDKKIISILLEHAKSLFNEQAEIQFEKDITFSERLELPVRFEDDTHSNLTKKRLQAADAQEEQQREEENHALETQDSSSEIQNKLISAAKTIDILGQLLRNFTGRLDGDTKKALLRETYSLSFRVINFFIDTYKVKSDELIDYIKAKLGNENEELTKNQIIPKVISFVYSILQLLSFNVFHRTAVAVAHSDLMLPYENLRNNMNQTNAFNLLHAFVKLNAEKNLQTFMNDEDFNSLRRKLFCMGLIRLEIVNFCYMYPVDFPVKQAACSKYGIQYSNLHKSEQLRKLT